MDSTELLKTLCAKEHIQYKDIAQILSDKIGRQYTYQSLSGKLYRDSLRFTEAYIIADALGYDLEPVKRK